MMMTSEADRDSAKIRCPRLSCRRVNSIIAVPAALALLGLCLLAPLTSLQRPSDIKSPAAAPTSLRSDRFLEVPRIVWGLNNQKIAIARACLTARLLDRILLMPSLSASLFYKDVDALQPIPFDEVFDFDEFNSRCDGFVRLGRFSEIGNSSNSVELVKGSGRRWTTTRDMDQMKLYKQLPYEGYEVIRIKGKNPFLWHDHWPVTDYAKIFSCMEFVDAIAQESAKVIDAIKADNGNLPYVAVHMRIEKDWMIHCQKLEHRLGINLICSSREEIMETVSRISGLPKPATVYLAVADQLLESGSVLDGWKQGILPFDKRKLGVWGVFQQQPYLIRSAIDFLVCSQAHIFVGNSFSTFSSLVVLQRTQRMIQAGVTESCRGGCGAACADADAAAAGGGDGGAQFASYAYNIPGEGGGPRRWVTNMADGSLHALSYGTFNISCNSHFHLS